MKNAITLITVLLLGFNTFAATGLDVLLQKVKSDQTTEASENAKRISSFKAQKDKQKQLLSQAKAELAALEKISVQLNSEFTKQEKTLTGLEDELNIAVGTLGEMFGVVRQVAGDMKGQLDTSIVSAQLQNRAKFMGELAEAKVLPTTKELENLWFEMQRELTESGKIVKYKREVVSSSGSKKITDVVRIGSFNLISDGKYLSYLPETGEVIELARQPASRYLSLAEDFELSNEKIAGIAIDPSRGSILSMLVQAPSLIERVQQGGIVGYVILFLLAIGLAIIGERYVHLKRESDKMKSQLLSGDYSNDNSLGRLMLAIQDNKSSDPETLEIKMEEELIRNTPLLQRGLPTVKILSAVAPLMGLLGTVTGMIVTFQSITLFGTGDPKLMAGGISQALVTTVLGLVCAIPLLLLHNVIAAKAKALIQILEEQAAGYMAKSMNGEKVTL